MNETNSIFELINAGNVQDLIHKRRQCKGGFDLDKQFHEELKVFLVIEKELSTRGWFEYLKKWDGQNTNPELKFFDLSCFGIVKSVIEPTVVFMAFMYPEVPKESNAAVRCGFDLSKNQGSEFEPKNLTLVGVDAPGFSYSYYKSVRNDLLTASPEEFEYWKEEFPTEYAGIELDKFSGAAIVATTGTEDRKKYSYLGPSCLCEPPSYRKFEEL